MRSFQFENNVQFLNKKLHTFGIKPSPLCSFCNLYDETTFHKFYECYRNRVKYLCSNLIQCFQNSLILPTLTPQTAIFGILNSASNEFSFKNIKAFVNHILLILKLHVDKSREKKVHK